MESWFPGGEPALGPLKAANRAELPAKMENGTKFTFDRLSSALPLVRELRLVLRRRSMQSMKSVIQFPFSRG